MRGTAIGLVLGLAGSIATAGHADAGPQSGAYWQNHCDRELVICYDRNGELFVDDQDASKVTDHLPANVRPGDVVTVVVLTRDDGDQDHVSVVFQSRKSLEHLFPIEANPNNKQFDARSLKPYVAISFPSNPISDDAADFTISFQRQTSTSDGAQSLEVIPVQLGYSYYSIALLVAATFKGDRHVLRDLDTTADHAVDPGLALNVFPFGRERGRIGYIGRCTRGRVQRCLADMIGFQLATDLDLRDPTDKLYGGLVFEPVAGLALSGGVSLRKVAVVPNPGALPATEAMTGPAPVDMRYVVRGYVGVTMTLELLNTISSVGTQIRAVKIPE